MPLLTPIILINYNNTRDTEKCIHSINASKGITPFIIIVDNASNDKEKVRELNNTCENIHIIINSKNYGFGYANNIGIQWAQENLKFDYLLLLNNDTLVEPESIDLLIRGFQKNSNTGISTCKIMYESNKDVVWYGGGMINLIKGWPVISDFNSTASYNGANKSRFVQFASGCVMLFSKKSLEILNGFDEDLFMYSEDLELSIRCTKLGFKIWYESTSVIYHKVQGSLSHSKTPGMHWENPNLPFLFFHMKTSQWLTMKKHLGRFMFLRFNIYFWLEFFYRILTYSFHGKWKMLITAIQSIKKIVSYAK